MTSNELEQRQQLVDAILKCPDWQYILELERHRDTVTRKEVLVEPLSLAERRPRRRAGDSQTTGLSDIPTNVRKRISTTLGRINIDAIETARRIEKKFLPKLKRVQKGRVLLFYCVEDYHGLNAHASILVGHLKDEKDDMNWRQRFEELAAESGLTLGRVTAWNEQWHDKDGLARYLMKSIDPTRFGNPESVLKSSSGIWGYSAEFIEWLGKHTQNKEAA